jgi:hypothetical protein
MAQPTSIVNEVLSADILCPKCNCVQESLFRWRTYEVSKGMNAKTFLCENPDCKVVFDAFHQL